MKELEKAIDARLKSWLKGYLFGLITFANSNRSLHMIGANWYDKEVNRILKHIKDNYILTERND